MDDRASAYIKGHQFVDLGLSVKWATCNIGAVNPEDFGDYFSWGQTWQSKSYPDDDCITKNKNIDDIAGSPRLDVARAKWGNPWRIPTEYEIKELIDNCTWKWTSLHGHNGYMITARESLSCIFLPASGIPIGTKSFGLNEEGSYWSSTNKSGWTRPELLFANCLMFDINERKVERYYRKAGLSVRPVCDLNYRMV